MEKLVVSVSQLNNYIKGLFDEIPVFRSVYVSGEISNFTNHYRTGHFYFTLKDEKAAVKAVMFRTYASAVKFVPKDGMQVLVKARLSVYERDGVYQLYVEDIQPKGLGGLNLAFEQLKTKLSAEGLFNESRKKPIPPYPSAVGVITSPTGAAVRDIMNVIRRRYPIAGVELEPITVQGEQAPAQIKRAIEKLNAENSCDVIIVGRGGGSAEDLWAFNDEGAARAAAASKIPIISAVGHETDFTIMDFVADLRAPTPSAAAELAVPDISEVKSELKSRKLRLDSSFAAMLGVQRATLQSYKSKPCLQNIGFVINEQRMTLDRLDTQCSNYIIRRYTAESQHFCVLAEKLEALSPLKVLNRGYSVVKNQGNTVTAAASLNIGDEINIKFASGGAVCTVKEKEV